MVRKVGIRMSTWAYLNDLLGLVGKWYKQALTKFDTVQTWHVPVVLTIKGGIRLSNQVFVLIGLLVQWLDRSIDLSPCKLMVQYRILPGQMEYVVMAIT